jgi:hypothetical protein
MAQLWELQAGAARGDRLSLRIGHGGVSDGWNAASSTGHEQAVGSGQRLRFVAIPLRKPACPVEARNLQRIAVVGSVYLGFGLT